jgi:hypothetical protein
MRFDGRQYVPTLDNLVPHVPTVLQTSWDLYLQAVDARDYDGQKYDAILEAVEVPEDPNGFYWQLKQFRIADSAAPSTTTLLLDRDLILNEVDVMALLPYRQILHNVRLEWVEPWLWRYVSDDSQ